MYIVIIICGKSHHFEVKFVFCSCKVGGTLTRSTKSRRLRASKK